MTNINLCLSGKSFKFFSSFFFCAHLLSVRYVDAITLFVPSVVPYILVLNITTKQRFIFYLGEVVGIAVWVGG